MVVGTSTGTVMRILQLQRAGRLELELFSMLCSNEMFTDRIGVIMHASDLKKIHPSDPMHA